MSTETRKPLNTGLGRAMDEAVPLYPTEAADALLSLCAALDIT